MTITNLDDFGAFLGVKPDAQRMPRSPLGIAQAVERNTLGRARMSLLMLQDFREFRKLTVRFTKTIAGYKLHIEHGDTWMTVGAALKEGKIPFSEGDRFRAFLGLDRHNLVASTNWAGPRQLAARIAEASAEWTMDLDRIDDSDDTFTAEWKVYYTSQGTRKTHAIALTLAGQTEPAIYLAFPFDSERYTAWKEAHCNV